LDAAPQKPKAKTAAKKKPAAKKTGPARSVVAGVDVSGLDAAGLSRRLNRVLKRKLNTKITLAAGSRKVAAPRGALGLRLDMKWMLARANAGAPFVPLKLSVDSKAAERAMKRIAPRLRATRRDARIVNLQRGMKVIPEVVGQELNVGAAVPRFAQAIGRDASQTRISLPVRKSTPRRTRSSFKGITGRLAVFSTGYNEGKVGRTRNMQLAAQAIDGTLIKPGGVFSLNDTVGERSRKRGYQAAIIFEDGKKKQGLGGGVSQITGTIFNAALLAGLPIVTYRTHSRPVAYIPIARDATVVWNGFDMKFRNDTGAPLYITYKVKNGTATASIFGKRVPGRRVSLRAVKKTLGPRRIEAVLFRTIRRNGKVEKKEKVGNSSYNWKVDNAD
jgi:vancomycin resistance protein YoaR